MKLNRMVLIGVASLLTVLPAVAGNRPLPQKPTFKTVDNDTISLNVVRGEPGAVRICLSTARSISWWKGVQIFGAYPGPTIGLLATTDQDHGPACRSIPLDDLLDSGSVLEFWKAKMFGVHTYIQGFTFKPSDYAGKELDFVWKSDS